MTKTDYKYYKEFESNRVTLSKIPKTLRKSALFQNLLSAGVIGTEKVGRGRRIIVKKPDAYAKFINKHFPDATNDTLTKASNIRKFRDSKARKTETSPIFFARGFGKIRINDQLVDLKNYTREFGLFAVQDPLIEAGKICFVENLDTFLKAEQVLGTSFIFLHKYGRVGINSIKGIKAREVTVFVDYDFNGLDEYLRIKSFFPKANLYVPGNFNALFETYSLKLNGDQKQSHRVAESDLPEVMYIRDLVARTNRFLEQEILVND